MLLCLTLNIIRYGSRVKWRNPGKGVAPSPTPWCSSYQKGSLRVTLDKRETTLLYFLPYIITIILSCHQYGYPGILSPLLIVHCFRQVLRSTSWILTALLYVGSSCPPYFCSAMCRGPYEYITYELFHTYPAVSCMYGSSNFDSFRDGW